MINIIDVNNDQDVYNYMESFVESIDSNNYEQNFYEIIKLVKKSNSNNHLNDKYIWIYDLDSLDYLMKFESLSVFHKLALDGKKGIKKYYSLIRKFHLIDLKKIIGFDSFKQFLKDNLQFIYNHKCYDFGNRCYISYKTFESFMKKLIKKYKNNIYLLHHPNAIVIDQDTIDKETEFYKNIIPSLSDLYILGYILKEVKSQGKEKEFEKYLNEEFNKNG